MPPRVLLFVFVALYSRLSCYVCTAQDTGKFWHVTDFHYDHTFSTSKLSCVQNVTNPLPLGDYWCDSPWALITASIDAMASLDKNVDFLLWTGDTVAHISDRNLNVTINMDVLQNLTQALKTAFPNKTVYATFGNHDYYLTDQFPDVSSIIYNRTAEMWSDWIKEEQQLTNFRKGGYYTRLVHAGLRIVALNTNLYYTSNKATPGKADPTGQFQWMKDVLGAARNAKEKVIITAHIPPGVHTPTRGLWFHQEFVEPFNAILRTFADIIVAMHFGHEHADGFKIFYDDKGQAAAPLFLAPSVTPWRYKLSTGETGPPHNPSVRLVTYDRTTGKHLDIQQFRLNLPDAKANFTLLYTFTQHYKVPDISAISMQTLVQRMHSESEGKQLLEDYYRFTTAGADQGEATCDSTCRTRFLCGFQHYTLDDFDRCVNTSQGAFLSASLLVKLLLLLHVLMRVTS